MTNAVYLARHASPALALTGIRYDVVPGPPLSEHGRGEAALLSEYLRTVGIRTIYASPFARTLQTAAIVAAATAIPVLSEPSIGEWHIDERARDVVARITPVLARVVDAPALSGPVCLLSHGGPIGVMLRKLGMPREVVDAHCARHGGVTPMPPAGVWRVVTATSSVPAQFDLVFVP